MTLPCPEEIFHAPRFLLAAQFDDYAGAALSADGAWLYGTESGHAEIRRMPFPALDSYGTVLVAGGSKSVSWPALHDGKVWAVRSSFGTSPELVSAPEAGGATTVEHTFPWSQASSLGYRGLWGTVVRDGLLWLGYQFSEGVQWEWGLLSYDPTTSVVTRHPIAPAGGSVQLFGFTQTVLASDGAIWELYIDKSVPGGDANRTSYARYDPDTDTWALGAPGTAFGNGVAPLDNGTVRATTATQTMVLFDQTASPLIDPCAAPAADLKYVDGFIFWSPNHKAVGYFAGNGERLMYAQSEEAIGGWWLNTIPMREAASDPCWVATEFAYLSE